MKRHTAAKLRFLGVRGSRPVHTALNTFYGGNSTCIEFDTGQNLSLLIDCGSGLQRMIYDLKKPQASKQLHILITHTHWDHVLMLPFLRQVEDSEFEVNFYAPDVAGRPFKDIFNMLMQRGRLPIPPLNLNARIKFNRVTPGQGFIIGGKVKVQAFQVNHQHMTLGYKISYRSSIVAIIPDIAAINHGNLLGESFQEQASVIGVRPFEQRYNRQLVDFLQDVPNLVFDTHFSTNNLKADWGHATPDIAIELCSKAKVKRLFMFHHAPEATDHDVARKQASAQYTAMEHGIEVINAREEDEWLLTAA